MLINGIALFYNSGKSDSFGGVSDLRYIFVESFLSHFLGGLYPRPIAQIRGPIL